MRSSLSQFLHPQGFAAALSNCGSESPDTGICSNGAENNMNSAHQRRFARCQCRLIDRVPTRRHLSKKLIEQKIRPAHFGRKVKQKLDRHSPCGEFRDVPFWTAKSSA